MVLTIVWTLPLLSLFWDRPPDWSELVLFQNIESRLVSTSFVVPTHSILYISLHTYPIRKAGETPLILLAVLPLQPPSVITISKAYLLGE